MVDELQELVAVGVEVGDRARGDSGVHGRPGHRRGDFGDEARVEGFRDQVLGPEFEVVLAIGGSHDVRLLRHGEIRDGAHRGELHRFVDRGRADVERAAKNERKAQDVIDLVRVIRTPRRHHRVGTHALRDIGQDLRLRVGEREDQRLVGHFRDHLRLENTPGREAEEDVCARNDFGERARRCLARIAGLVRIHFFLAALVHHTLDVRDPDVVGFQSQADQQIEAGERRRARARADELHSRQFLAHHPQPVQHCGADDDGGAVLIVVKHRDLHALAQLALDVEAFRGLDVLEVDSAERGLQRRDDLDQLLRIALAHLDVEAIDPGEFLEEHRLAFHHGFRRERPDRSQPQHGGPVCHNADKVSARSHVACLGRVAHDLLAGRRHPGGVGKREIALVHQAFGGGDRNLSRRWPAVIFQGAPAQRVFHGEIRT